jgi:hypothetical protein
VAAKRDGLGQVHLEKRRDGRIEMLAADLDVFHEQQIVPLGDHRGRAAVADVHD